MMTFGYYAQGVAPETAMLPDGWEARLIAVRSPATRGATGLCLEVHDLVLSKYAAGREKNLEFVAAAARHGLVERDELLRQLSTMPIDDARKQLVRGQINANH